MHVLLLLIKIPLQFAQCVLGCDVQTKQGKAQAPSYPASPLGIVYITSELCPGNELSHRIKYKVHFIERYVIILYITKQGKCGQ